MKIYLKAIGVIVMLMALYGCGGGSSSGESQLADTDVLPAKATLTFSAMSTAQLPASVSISAIDFSLVLPTGMDVTTDSGVGVTGGIAKATLTSAYSVEGNYNSVNRTATLAMINSSNNYRSGEFMRMTCTVASNTNISLGDLKKANSPVVIVKAVGYDSTLPPPGIVSLTGQFKVTIGAVK